MKNGEMNTEPLNNSGTPRWLRLKEAAAYSSIGTQRLIRLALAGRVDGFQDRETKKGVWIFDRHSLDAYHERRMLADMPCKIVLPRGLGAL